MVVHIMQIFFTLINYQKMYNTLWALISDTDLIIKPMKVLADGGLTMKYSKILSNTKMLSMVL